MTARGAGSVIAVDGIDGSGKSTFARGLRTRLAAEGAPAAIVSVDDFRRPIAWASLAVPEVDAYYSDYYDLAQADACIRAFLAGERSVTIPRYDLLRETIDGTHTLDFGDAQVLIVEGVFPLRIPVVGEALLVFLAASPAEARRRIVARDIHKGRSAEEAERRIDQRYFPAQQRYHAERAPRDRADVVIDNERPTEPAVLRRDLTRVSPALHAMLDRALPGVAGPGRVL